MIYAILLFAATYVLMLALPKYRTYVALVSALCFIISGMLPLDQVLGSIDFNVLLMIAGTMELYLCLSNQRCRPCLRTLSLRRCRMPVGRRLPCPCLRE